MKFKGTKGKWLIGNGEIYRPASSGSISPYWSQICSMVNDGTDEYKANALLISKAPEMLEMLQKCKEYFLLKTDKYSDERADAIRQLIKDATEINTLNKN